MDAAPSPNGQPERTAPFDLIDDGRVSPNPWSDGRSDRDGNSFRFHSGRRTMGEMMRVDPLSYEELERSGSAAFCSSVKRASDRFQGKNDSGLSTA